LIDMLVGLIQPMIISMIMGAAAAALGGFFESLAQGSLWGVFDVVKQSISSSVTSRAVDQDQVEWVIEMLIENAVILTLAAYDFDWLPRLSGGESAGIERIDWITENQGKSNWRPGAPQQRVKESVDTHERTRLAKEPGRVKWTLVESLKEYLGGVILSIMSTWLGQLLDPLVGHFWSKAAVLIIGIVSLAMEVHALRGMPQELDRVLGDSMPRWMKTMLFTIGIMGAGVSATFTLKSALELAGIQFT
jgi:hypothetical protein